MTDNTINQTDKTNQTSEGVETRWRDWQVAGRLAGTAVDRAFDGLLFWPAWGLLAYVVACLYGWPAGIAAYVVLVIGVAAAPAVGEWLFWRRIRPAAAPTFQRLSVYINEDSARVLREVKRSRGISATEAIRRAVGLLGFFEGAGLPPAGTEPGPAPAGPARNYVQITLGRLLTAVPGLYAELAQLYTLLVLVRGTGTTLRDVHDAWAVWRNVTAPEHRSLVPFDQLPVEVQELDRPFMDAIHLVAASIEGGQR